MAQIETKQTTTTFAERFGRVAANGVIGAAALASAFLPMAATAQTVTDVANRAPAAHSFNLRQCVTVAQLQAAGQRSVLQAEKMVPVATNRPIILYSANTNGSIGYELVADRPVAPDARGQWTQPQTPACYTVRAQTLNVRINDVASGGVRRDFYQPIANSNLNNSIDAGLRNGSIPVLQATVMVEGRRGPLVTVFSSGAAGLVINASVSGLTATSDTLRSVNYTQHSASYFPRSQQVATFSLTGN